MKIKHLILILTLLLITGCAQLTGPPKAEYVIEECVTHYRWDEESQFNRVTHMNCTKSSGKSNRVLENGVEFKQGTTHFKAGGVKNAEESSIAKALGSLLANPDILQSTLTTLLNKENK